MTWKKLFPFHSDFYALPDGNRIHVASHGKGFPVIMLHGNPTWAFMFRSLMAALPESQFQSLAVDHLGCGLSDKPQDYNYCLENHLENLTRIIQDSLRLERFDLVLHDWGGPIGMGYAVRHPQQVRNIVAMNTVAWFTPQVPKAIRLTQCPWLGAFLVRKLNLILRIALKLPCQPLEKDVVKAFKFPYGNYHDRIAIQRFPQDIPLSPKHPSAKPFQDLEQNLKKLDNHPLLICWGMQDRCFPPEFLKTWTRFLPQATVKTFQDASHFLLEDQPKQVCDAILDFLTEGHSV